MHQLGLQSTQKEEEDTLVYARCGADCIHCVQPCLFWSNVRVEYYTQQPTSLFGHGPRPLRTMHTRVEATMPGHT